MPDQDATISLDGIYGDIVVATTVNDAVRTEIEYDYYGIAGTLELTATDVVSVAIDVILPLYAPDFTSDMEFANAAAPVCSFGAISKWPDMPTCRLTKPAIECLFWQAALVTGEGAHMKKVRADA